MHISTLKLISLLANHLTGKPILVREREPATANTWGEAHKTEGGQLVIDLSPKIPDHKRLYVILHEIAHHKRHNFLATKVYKAKPGTLEQEPSTLHSRLSEGGANMQAAEWQAWAEQHANPQLYKAAPLEAALIALLEYPQEGDK